MPVLLLALTSACRATPVLNDTIEETDAPPALAAASAIPSAAPSGFAPPPLRANVVSFSGFPRCPPARPPEPEEPLVWLGGNAFKPPKRKPHHDDWRDLRDLGLRLETCFHATLSEPTKSAVTMGILPSGAICAPKMLSTAPLPAKCVACLAQRFRAYRFAPADGNPEFTFNLPAFVP